jgi:uncharacterized protein involved in outer membrane biogenesis
MSLTRKAKIWVVIISIPVLLIIAGAITLKVLFTSEKLKELVVPRAEETTQRTVSVGSINLSIFPHIALEIDSLAVSNRKEEGFSESPMLAMDKLVLDVKLWPLFRGDVEITTIELRRPHILIEYDKRGKPNYDTKTTTETPAAEGHPPTSEAGKGAFLLSNLQIVDGVVELINHQENSAMKLEGLNSKIRVQLDRAANQLRTETQSSIGSLSYGTVTSHMISGLRATLNQNFIYAIGKDELLLEHGTGTVNDIALTTRGKITNLSTTFLMDIAVESNSVNIAELLSLAPKEYMKRAEGLKGNGTAQIKLIITGTSNDSTKPDVAGSISATNASIQYAQLPKPITSVNIVAEFLRTAKKQELKVTKFSANLGNNPLSATLTVVNFDDPSLTMAVNAGINLAEVKDYYPIEKGTELSGQMKANVNIAGRVSNPNTMKAAGTMDFQNVTIKTATSKNPIQNLQGTITFNNQIIEAKRLSMTLGKSDLTLSFWLKNYLSMMADQKDKSAPKPVANLNLASNHLYTADIMPEEPETASSSGTQQGAMRGKQPAERKGKLPLPNVEMDIAATIGTLTMEKLVLSSVKSTMKVADGIVNIQNLSANTFDGSVSSKGTINLQNPERPLFDLALDMTGIAVNPMLSQFSSFGQKLFGKLTMNTTLKGALDDTLGLVPKALSGQGRVQIENGKVTGVPTNQAIASLLNVPDMKEINFKDWANSFSIADGRLQLKDLKITALGADYLLNGSHGFDGSLDYSLTLLLSEATSQKATIPGVAGQAIDFLKDESGRIKLDFIVGGGSDDPKIQLNTDAIKAKLEAAAQAKLKQEQEKLQQKLEEKGKDLLKDLFKKK